MGVAFKHCPRCNCDKPMSQFSVDKNRKDGNACYCKQCDNARTKLYQETKAGKRTLRSRRLMYAFGITIEQFENMLVKQDGRCANQGCRTSVPGGNGSFYVDHDHSTGKIRGLLCHMCNVGIGLFRDDASVMLGAVEYLKKHT